MRDQIRSEIRKLLSVRTGLYLLVGAIGLAVVAAWSAQGQADRYFEMPLVEQQFMFLGTFVKLLVLVLGIRLVTDEYRYGTIMPTFAVTAKRSRVVAAKGFVAVVSGLALGIIAQATLVGTGWVIFDLAGHDLVIGSRGALAIFGGVAASVLWTVVGVGVGLIVKSTTAAIVGSFVWLMGLEEMLRSQIGDLGTYLPGQAGVGLALAPTDGGMGVSALTLGLYAAVAMGAGLLLTRRRDVV